MTPEWETLGRCRGWGLGGWGVTLLTLGDITNLVGEVWGVGGRCEASQRRARPGRGF